MKKISFILILFVTAFGFSQNHGILKGTILDLEMQNEPLLFANVRLKGTAVSTETNFHGNFEFDHLISGTYTLVISYAGYENIEMPVTVMTDETVHLNLGMAAKQISFDETSGMGLWSARSVPKPTSSSKAPPRK